jgi:hypothetical protein
MKKLLELFVLLFTMLFTYAVIAQEMSLVRRGHVISVPEKVQTPLGSPLAEGTYTIGATGNFPTIDSAFNKLSIDGISGAVTFELIDNLYVAPLREYGFFLNGPIPGAGLDSRVIIKPALNKNVTIEGTGISLIGFLNTSYLTIDGVGLTGATTLTIHALKDTQYVFNDGIDFMDNSDHNFIQNTTFISEDYDRDNASIGCFPTSSSSPVPDSNLFQYNHFKKSGLCIIMGSSPSARVTGTIIRNNFMGSENDSLVTWGIHVQGAQNVIIENNTIQNLRRNISLENPWVTIVLGINSYWGMGCIIRNNIIHNIHDNGSNLGAVGILLSGGSGEGGSNNQIYNNMVYDISSTSTISSSRVAGIQMWYQNNPKIYYNSVYLSGNGNGGNPIGSAALYIRDNNTNVEVKNNILVNTRDEAPYCAAAIQGNSGFNSTISNYNALYYQPSQYNYLVKYGLSYLTLANWQSTGKDLNSVTEMPNFATPHLHINDAIPTYIEKGATPIAGIDTDFDGQTRNAILPDIGADEFYGTVVPVELTSFTAKANGTEVTLTWSTATELNNYGFEVQRKVLGGEFSTVAFVKGHGTTTQKNEYSFLDQNLDEGKYSYRLKQVDLDGKFEYSKIIEVEVISITSYSLGQNYPNPFNPSTTITYALKEKCDVKLTLLNSLGEELAILVNEEQDKGFHKVEFGGSKLSSGVYFYKLHAGKYIETKKMILLR